MKTNMPPSSGIIKLNLQIYPKGRNIKGLMFYINTKWLTIGEVSYHMSCVAANTTKVKRGPKKGSYIAQPIFLPSPADSYYSIVPHRIIAGMGVSVSVPSTVGEVITNGKTKLSPLIMATTTLKNGFVMYVVKDPLQNSMYPTRLKLTNKKTKTVYTELIMETGLVLREAAASFDVPPGVYELAYDKKIVWDAENPNPLWNELGDVTIKKNEVVLQYYYQSWGGNIILTRLPTPTEATSVF